MRYLSLLFLILLLGCQQKTSTPFVVQNKTILDDTTQTYFFPRGITIEKNGILEIQPGVKIALGKLQNIIVYGTLNAHGTKKTSIKIFAEDSLFNRIVFKAGSQNNIISFANIIDGAIGIERTRVKLHHINMYFNTIRETKIAWPVIYSKLGNVEIRNSYITNNSGGWVGEGIVALGGKINIFDSDVKNIPDAIEFTQVENAIINHVYITNSGDDGIDLNSCQNISIKNSIIENISDKAITIGGSVGFSEIIDSLPTPPSTNITVSNCLIQNSKIGISVKDSSDISVSESAFLNTKTGFKIYEKDKGQGTGKLTLHNVFVVGYSSFVTDKYQENIVTSNIITDKQESKITSQIVEHINPIKTTPKKFNYNDFIKQYTLKTKRK